MSKLEETRERMRKWRMNNPERNLEINRAAAAKMRALQPERLREYVTQRKIRDPEGYKKAMRASARRKKYGLTEVVYNIILKDQEYKCALCLCVLVFEGRKTHIDHCHDTNEVRGVLCARCNTALGYFENVICRWDTDIFARYMRGKYVPKI